MLDLNKMFEKDSFAGHLGMTVSEVDSTCARVSMPFDERHRNAMGQTHGGAIFALADMAFAVLANSQNIGCVSAQSSISFLSPGKTGPLTAEAHFIRKGRKLVHVEVRVWDATQSQLAQAVIVGYVTSV